MGTSPRALGRVVGAICVALLLLGSAAHAQSVVELTWFDRPVAACLPGMAKDEDCSARVRLLVEVAPRDWVFGPVHFYLRSEMFARRSPDEAGHATPVSADLGGGAGMRWGNWTARMLLSSRHCFDTKCASLQAYNALVLRWEG